MFNQRLVLGVEEIMKEKKNISREGFIFVSARQTQRGTGIKRAVRFSYKLLQASKGWKLVAL